MGIKYAILISLLLASCATKPPEMSDKDLTYILKHKDQFLRGEK